jgi:hypothetical protein
MANTPPWISKIDGGDSSNLVDQDSLLIGHFCISNNMCENIKLKPAGSATIQLPKISLASLPQIEFVLRNTVHKNDAS